MGFASRQNIDFTVPGLQNRDRQTCRASKAKKPNPFSILSARNTYATKADDAGTQQGSNMDIV